MSQKTIQKNVFITYKNIRKVRHLSTYLNTCSSFDILIGHNDHTYISISDFVQVLIDILQNE